MIYSKIVQIVPICNVEITKLKNIVLFCTFLSVLFVRLKNYIYLCIVIEKSHACTLTYWQGWKARRATTRIKSRKG